VTGFIENAVRANDVAGLRRLGLDPTEVATMLSDAFAFQLFETGFVHADPHPGNILVRVMPSANGESIALPPLPQVPADAHVKFESHSCIIMPADDPKAPPLPRRRRAQCIVLDHGLCFDLSQSERELLADIWTGCASHDTPLLKRTMASMGMNPKEYALLGSMFLQFPYETFSPFRRAATPDELERMRRQSSDKMPEISALLEKMPKNFALALRNITTYRALHKDLGNPVSRTQRMLRFSVPVSVRTALRAETAADAAAGSRGSLTHRASLAWRGGAAGQWCAVQWALLRLRCTEWYIESLLAFARWWDPKTMEVVDEILQI
jgi:hypothetical protein